MGKSQRDKGARIERKVANLLKSEGIEARRIPYSGAGHQKGDIEFGPCFGMVAEVKGGKSLPTGRIRAWLGGHDALFLMEDREEPLIVLPMETFKELIK